LSWHRYLFVLLGTAVLVVSAGATVNFVVDLQALYGGHNDTSYYDKYARELLNSRFGLVGARYERSIKLRLAQLSDADCYVTGSSREMQIDLDTMPSLASNCRKITNLAVSRGAFEDFVAAAGRVAENPRARRLFIGVQSWGFRERADNWWTEEKEAYLDARRIFGFDNHTRGATRDWEKFQNLISGEYLQRNLEEVWDKGFKVGSFPSIVQVDQDDQPSNSVDQIFRPSGRLQYSRTAISKIPAPVATVGDGSYKLSPGVPTFDPLVAAQYRKIAEKLTARGIAIEYLLMPFHPKVWECSKPFVCSSLISIEANVRTLARDQRTKVIGSFDPGRLGLDWRAFMDDMHLDAKAHHKVPIYLADETSRVTD
jgi:hypothetical protein